MLGQKQKIRENRMKVRVSIRTTYVKDVGDGRLGWKLDDQKDQSATKRRRKTSECFESFQSMSIFKDQYTKESFQTLFNKLEKIGQGAQSQVYKCLERKTGKLYAVKISKKRDLQLIESMRQCYQVLKQLQHESIVKGKYLFINQKKLTCHLVEQLGEYPNLRVYMNRNFNKVPKQKRVGIITEFSIAHFLRIMFEILSYMKEKGVCHRDIKPENILYSPIEQSVKIIDFQLARMQRYSHQKLFLMSQGSIVFLLILRDLNRLWAVGVIAFEMITGVLPFKSFSSQKTIDLICNQDIDYTQYNLPKYTQSFLSRMLAKNPQKRLTPKQALSCPFMLINSSAQSEKTKIKKCCSFDEQSDQSSSSEQRCMTPSRYYEIESQFSFADTINQDMGVRFCTQ